MPKRLPPEDDHAAVREIVDSSMGKLQEWLDKRLQQQDDMLRRLSNHHDFPRTPTSDVKATQMRNSKGAAHMTSPNHDSEPSNAPSFGAQSGHTHRTHIFRSSSERAGRSNSSISCVDEEQSWISNLVGAFDQLDLNQTGCIDISEFKEVSKELGIPIAQAKAVFNMMDKSKNGTIDRMEWLHTISGSAKGRNDEKNHLIDFLSRLMHLQESRGHIYEANRARRPRLILRHDSIVRVAWDVLMIAFLCYISLSLPYSLGFGEDNILKSIDFGADMFFCFDVLLNFRTSYRDRQDALVVDGKHIALRYLKSWFLLDFFSAVPFDLITEGLLPNLSPARLLKLGKIAKVLKLLRLSKVKSVRAESEFLESVKLRLASRKFCGCFRMARLAAIAFIVAHWLACFGSAVDSCALEEYFDKLNQEPNVPQRYLAAMYWAMTTISTVGYGDITPVSDSERAYAMIAMVIGGSLYGYVVGSVTSIVTDIDVQAHRYYERMDLIQSWLERHVELPLLLRKRVRKYFKQASRETMVISDSSVVNQLSPELRGDAAFFLVHEQVRLHPMFLNHPNSALAELLHVLQETHARAQEFIVRIGDPGIGMYILVLGLARYDQGWKWQPPNAEGKHINFQHVVQGESFGEEIIFGLEETYVYTIITIADSKFHWISEDGFLRHFKFMPELHDQMYAAFLKSRNWSEFDILAEGDYTTI